MKAPEYIVIKAMPGFKKGDELIKMENSDFYCDMDWMPTITIAHELIKQCPEYFKLIEEKEFTASDMESYHAWCTYQSPGSTLSIPLWREYVAELQHEKPL